MSSDYLGDILIEKFYKNNHDYDNLTIAQLKKVSEAADKLAEELRNKSENNNKNLNLNC